MKAGTHAHIKTIRLERLLGVPKFQAVGILEMLFMLAIECADDGAVGKYSDEDIAAYLGWPGEATALIQTLVTAGWLDEDPNCRLVIHDWMEHCPDFIYDRVRKREQRQAAKCVDNSEVAKNGRRGKRGDVSDCPDVSQLVPTCPNDVPKNPYTAIPVYSSLFRTGADPEGGSPASDPARKSEPLRSDDLTNSGNGNGTKGSLRQQVIASRQDLQELAQQTLEPLEPRSLARNPKRSVFAPVTAAALRHRDAMESWFLRQLGHPKPVTDRTRADLAFVLAAKQLALDQGDNPAALFATLVGGQRWDSVAAYLDEAVLAAKAFDPSKHPP